MEMFLAVLQQLPRLGGVEVTLRARVTPSVRLGVALHVLTIQSERHGRKITRLAHKLDRRVQPLRVASHGLRQGVASIHGLVPFLVERQVLAL